MSTEAHSCPTMVAEQLDALEIEFGRSWHLDFVGRVFNLDSMEHVHWPYIYKIDELITVEWEVRPYLPSVDVSEAGIYCHASVDFCTSVEWDIDLNDTEAAEKVAFFALFFGCERSVK